MDYIIEMMRLFAYDLILIALYLTLIIPLLLFKKAAYAIMKRNFIGYFSNPTGYVFLCLFVLLTSFAAFWPHEFFNSNMATLDQLNRFLPYIMLVFIPAITMSIWAEERRGGTDELLLTIPAGDFDVVLGKYLAAASIFSVSLLFSQLSNFAVLNGLARGGVDMGLFYTTYLGYWLVGLSMLSIGMIASFLTNNLTVGFILGAVFNTPLVFAANSDVIVPWDDVAQTVNSWSLSAKLEDFGRGVVSLSGIVYFVLLISIGIYLSVVLIGRRHWVGGRSGRIMFGHHLARIAAIAVLAAGVNVLATNRLDVVRKDLSTEQISSLSNATYDVMDSLNWERTVYIDAFISKTLPESYLRTKYEIVSTLRELKAQQSNIVINIHDDMERFSEAAKEAEEQYDIRPRIVQTQSRGAQTEEPIYLAAAVECGLERVVIPFFGHGNSVEYELIRSIATVTGLRPAGDSDEDVPFQSQRPVVGIVTTDANLEGFGSVESYEDLLEMIRINWRQGKRGEALGEPVRIPPQAIIQEIRKQYRIETVDCREAIKTGFEFSVKDRFAGDLDRRTFPADLHELFREGGLRLEDDVKVWTIRRGYRWVIQCRKEGEAEQVSFTIRKIGNRLNVYDRVNYDVLLVAQPSSLSERQMTNLINAMQKGQPVAMFEDPYPVSFGRLLLATDRPRDALSEPTGEAIPFEQKGDFSELLKFLELRLLRAKQTEVPRVNPPPLLLSWRPHTAVVWQDFNPYPKIQQFGRPGTIVFANPNSVGANPQEQIEIFNVHQPAVSNMDEIAFMFPGAVEQDEQIKKDKNTKSVMDFTPLVRTSKDTGLLVYTPSTLPPEVEIAEYLVRPVEYRPDLRMYFAEDQTPYSPQIVQAFRTSMMLRADNESYILAARVTSKSDEDIDDPETDEPPPAVRLRSDVDVILVSDLDVLHSGLVTWRDRPSDINFKFQNTAFVLNILDVLAGDYRFVDIRKRQVSHASLRLIEDRIRAAYDRKELAKEEFEQELNEEARIAAQEQAKLAEAFEKRIGRLKAEGRPDDDQEILEARQKLNMQNARNRADADRKQDEAERRLRRKEEEEDRKLELEKQKIQNEYKFLAVVIPPIPPLIVGIIVFVRRRFREREGVSAARLRVRSRPADDDRS